MADEHIPYLQDIGSLQHQSTIEQLSNISHHLSGWATFTGLEEAVNDLAGLAPKDHDILIRAFDIAVREVRFIEPHSLLFIGVGDDGHHTFIVVHFSQVVAHVVYLPKQGPERIITGFSSSRDAAENNG